MSLSRSGIRFDPWHLCDRCGSLERSSRLIRQRGLFVCTSCVDSYLQLQRLQSIQRVLSDGKQEASTWLDNQVFDEGVERGEF